MAYAELLKRNNSLMTAQKVLAQLPAKDLVDGLRARVAAKLHIGVDEHAADEGSDAS